LQIRILKGEFKNVFFTYKILLKKGKGKDTTGLTRDEMGKRREWQEQEE
jgi:hypothetical protein